MRIWTAVAVAHVCCMFTASPSLAFHPFLLVSSKKRWSMFSSLRSSSLSPIVSVVEHLPSAEDDDVSSLPLSTFGTKEYWDEVYAGRGDFPSHEYSWYYGWNELNPYLAGCNIMPNKETCKILLPGIGNDPLLIDLVASGYKRLTAQDYSQHAVDRQLDLLKSCCTANNDCIVQLSCSNVKNLPQEWTSAFDVVLEKGLLDAVYLSGEGNIQVAVQSLAATLKNGGVFVSVSGVVPDDLRRKLFASDGWEWLRDGSQDLKAGCFIFRKLL